MIFQSFNVISVFSNAFKLLNITLFSSGNISFTKTDVYKRQLLTYDLKFNWKFIWKDAGVARMDMQAVTYQGKPCFRTNLVAATNGMVDFFFKMRDTLTCIKMCIRDRYIDKPEIQGS